MIKISYQIDAKEMTKVSVAFLNVKPFSRFAVMAINIGAIFILGVLIIKILTDQMMAFEWLVALVALGWLFARKRANYWLLRRRIEKQQLDGRPVVITCSVNGIIWEGAKVSEGHIAWDSIKYCYEIKEGFILPTSTARFLWLPRHGFESPTQYAALKQLFKEKGVHAIKRYLSL